MIEILKSATFESWLVGLKDRQARLRVISRIERLSAGNPGDVKPVGAGVFAQVCRGGGSTTAPVTGCISCSAVRW